MGIICLIQYQVVAQEYIQRRLCHKWGSAYPDLIVMTESGKLLLVETKGDYLKNDESREKAEIGATWAAKASQLGRIYKYFMVYETKKPEYAGAYSHERFMEIVRGL